MSGRGQNWLDVDGSVTGLGERSVIGSGLSSAGMWWKVDDEGMLSITEAGFRVLSVLTLLFHPLQLYTNLRLHFGSSDLAMDPHEVSVTLSLNGTCL